MPQPLLTGGCWLTGSETDQCGVEFGASLRGCGRVRKSTVKQHLEECEARTVGHQLFQVIVHFRVPFRFDTHTLTQDALCVNGDNAGKLSIFLPPLGQRMRLMHTR